MNRSLQRADDFADVLANEDGTYPLVIARTPDHIAVMLQKPMPQAPTIIEAKCVYTLPSHRNEPCDFTRDFLHFLVVERRPRTALEAQRFTRQWADLERKRK